jgi:peroxiredoxin
VLAGTAGRPYPARVLGCNNLPVARLIFALLLAGACVPSTAAAASQRPDGERPLPAFDGYTLDGKSLSISDSIGKRLVLFFFNPEVPESLPVAEAVRGIARERGSHNFAVIGVAVGSSRARAVEFKQQASLDFPIIDDSGGSITRRFDLQSPISLIAVDAEGYVTFVAMSFDASGDDASGRIEDRIREQLRLPEREPELALPFGTHPRAPAFEAPRLSGGDPFSTDELAGKPMILIFFLHTCSHCHKALEFFKAQLSEIPETQRPALIGVSLLDRPSAVRQMLAEREFELSEVLLDPSRDLQRLYGMAGTVPDISFIDSSGGIVHRIRGWSEKRDPAIARMVVAKIAGLRIPMILNPKGYTGDEVCGVCHELERESWLYTEHASAFDTLVTHGEARNPECVGCHVVGFDQPGGYTIAARPTHLENVSCESCHGRGGPHLSKDFVAAEGYESVCQTCHNPTHSLGFDYASFRPVISHTAIAALPAEERAALSRSRPGSLLPSGIDYVGSDQCESCHPKEFATWSASPHALALASLEARGAKEKTDCLECHTTGFGQPGGFAASAAASSHPDLARVGCESCHGPGAAHVEPDAKKIGTIISLGDKCDSCVILQICGGCHDDANDPGFEFEVVDKIERQRHGTIQPGSGEPIEKTATAGPRVQPRHASQPAMPAH